MEKGRGLVGGESFFKIQNLIVDEAKNATLVALDSTFVEYLDHFLSQLNKKVRAPKICNLMLPILKITNLLKNIFKF